MRQTYLGLICAWLLVACARGAAVKEASDAGSFVDDATAEDAGTEVDAGSAPLQQPDANASRDASTTRDAGKDAGDTALSCAAPSGSCTDAQDLGDIAGNVDGAALSQTGSGSAWFRISVRDDGSNGFVESAMGIGLKLTPSTDSDNYDLFLYRSGDAACADQPFAATQPSGDEALDHIWNAAGPAMGETRTLVIEVRQIGASCGAWSLEIEPHPCSNYTAPSGDTCATK